MRYGSFFIVVAYGCPKTLFPPTKSPFPLCQKSALCVWPISVLLPWLVSLSHVHCPYYYVFVVSLRIRWCLPPALVFVLHPLHFCMNFRIHLPFSTKSMLGFWLEYLESTDWLGENWHLYDCAGSVSTAGLGLPSLERPTCQVDVWKLGFWETSHHSQNRREWSSVLQLSEDLLSFWKSGILVCARQRVSIWTSPSKNFGYWVLELLWLWSTAGGIKFTLKEGPGRISWELTPGFLLTLLHLPFPLLVLLYILWCHKSQLWPWWQAEWVLVRSPDLVMFLETSAQQYWDSSIETL